MSGTKGESSVEALRDRILVLTKHIDAATKSKSNQQSKDIIRLKLCDAYSELTTKYPKECNRERKMVVTMWQYCFYKRIGEIRVRIMRLQSRNRPIEQEKMLLNKFIREGIAYIQFLLRKCEDYHVLRISLMGYLGDLHRYKGDYAGAEKLYNDVIKLDPRQGVSYNGIAVVNQENKLYLNSVYYYVRSMTVRGEKYCNGLSNLQRVFREVKRLPDPGQSDKTKRFVNNLIQLIDTLTIDNSSEPVVYYELIRDFTGFVSTRSLGELILIKINIILMFFSIKHDSIFELLIVLNEKIVDDIIAFVDHEKKKKNVRYLAPVVVLLDYFVQNKLVHKVEKFGSFVLKIEKMLKKYSYLTSNAILSKRYLKEHLNLRGCSLLNYEIEDTPFKDIERNIANDESSTQIRLSRASDFMTIVKVAVNLSSLKNDIITEQVKERNNSENHESDAMSISDSEDDVDNDHAVENVIINIEDNAEDEEDKHDDDDEEEDIVVFKPQMKHRLVAQNLPQAIGNFEVDGNASMPPLPPPGFAPLINCNDFPIVSKNPFLSFSSVREFEPEKKVDSHEEDPMNIMGSIFGGSRNPFLD